MCVCVCVCVCVGSVPGVVIYGVGHIPHVWVLGPVEYVVQRCGRKGLLYHGFRVCACVD